ncbi:MAG: hypothetical protein KAQ85_01510 [Thermodesulfovibrionia bacterium]|nr:hypothetical protein [Thermodesulfovibrionia bacterium]
MHREVLTWLKETKTRHPNLFEGMKVLEAGSLDINGSPRQYFADSCEYIGVDAKQGKGVDWWGLFHEYPEKPKGYFDVVVSCEVVEHDPFWRTTLKAMVDFIRADGALFLSYAGPLRHAHGTHYHSVQGGGESQEYHPLGPETDYYWNVRPEMVLYELFQHASFNCIEYNSYRSGQDICIVAMGKYIQKIDYCRGEIINLRKREKTKI